MEDDEIDIGTVTVVSWSPQPRHTLIGFVRIAHGCGLTLDWTVLTSRRGGFRAIGPSRPLLMAPGGVGSGNVVRHDDGRIFYQPVIAFRDAATRERFSSQILRALRLFAPDALEWGEAEDDGEAADGPVFQSTQYQPSNGRFEYCAVSRHMARNLPSVRVVDLFRRLGTAICSRRFVVSGGD